MAPRKPPKVDPSETAAEAQWTIAPFLSLAPQADVRRWREREMLHSKVGGLLYPRPGVVEKQQECTIAQGVSPLRR